MSETIFRSSCYYRLSSLTKSTQFYSASSTNYTPPPKLRFSESGSPGPLIVDVSHSRQNKMIPSHCMPLVLYTRQLVHQLNAISLRHTISSSALTTVKPVSNTHLFPSSFFFPLLFFFPLKTHLPSTPHHITSWFPRARYFFGYCYVNHVYICVEEKERFRDFYSFYSSCSSRIKLLC